MEKMQILYMNKQTGELLTKSEARKQFREWYDGDDETNMFCFADYYEEKVLPNPFEKVKIEPNFDDCF